MNPLGFSTVDPWDFWKLLHCDLCFFLLTQRNAISGACETCSLGAMAGQDRVFFLCIFLLCVARQCVDLQGKRNQLARVTKVANFFAGGVSAFASTFESPNPVASHCDTLRKHIHSIGLSIVAMWLNHAEPSSSMFFIGIFGYFWIFCRL